MEPEPENVDLSVLDPRRDGARWDRMVENVAARAVEQRRLRLRAVRRGAIAAVMAIAAALAVWFGAPKRDPVTHTSGDLLEWAVRDVEPSEVLGLGGNDGR
jgi:hypothetical protein